MLLILEAVLEHDTSWHERGRPIEALKHLLLMLACFHGGVRVSKYEGWRSWMLVIVMVIRNVGGLPALSSRWWGLHLTVETYWPTYGSSCWTLLGVWGHSFSLRGPLRAPVVGLGTFANISSSQIHTWRDGMLPEIRIGGTHWCTNLHRWV